MIIFIVIFYNNGLEKKNINIIAYDIISQYNIISIV